MDAVEALRWSAIVYVWEHAAFGTDARVRHERDDVHGVGCEDAIETGKEVGVRVVLHEGASGVKVQERARGTHEVAVHDLVEERLVVEDVRKERGDGVAREAALELALALHHARARLAHDHRCRPHVDAAHQEQLLVPSPLLKERVRAADAVAEHNVCGDRRAEERGFWRCPVSEARAEDVEELLRRAQDACAVALVVHECPRLMYALVHEIVAHLLFEVVDVEREVEKLGLAELMLLRRLELLGREAPLALAFYWQHGRRDCGLERTDHRARVVVVAVVTVATMCVSRGEQALGVDARVSRRLCEGDALLRVKRRRVPDQRAAARVGEFARRRRQQRRRRL